jgi:hypothetical protein
VSDHGTNTGRAALESRVAGAELDEGAAIEVLRSPFCTAEIAETIARSPRLTSAHRVRELLCTIKGMSTSRVHDLVSGLPWLSLLRLAQAPNAPPPVRRLAERRLVLRLSKMTLGEKIAFARRAHRVLFKHLIATGQATEVFLALIDNPRMTESDVVLLLGSAAPSREVVRAIVRSNRWASRRGVRMAVTRCPTAPLPVALSALAELAAVELRQVIDDGRVPAAVRDGARGLLERRCGGDRERC